MWQDHPSIEELETFLLRPKRGGNTSLVVRHLLADCPACRDRLQQNGWSPERLERLLRMPEAPEASARSLREPASPYNYDQAFERSEKTLSAFMAGGRPVEEPPPELLAEILLLPAAGEIPPLSRENRSKVPHLVKWLIQRSHTARYGDPGKMLEWAHMAHLAVEACSAEDAGGEERLSDLKGQAWRQFGNALRVCGNLTEAGTAMVQAEACLKAGTGDLSLRALYLQQMSSLRTFERRFAEAIELAGEAGEIYDELDDPNGLASTLVQQAIAHTYAGASEPAISLLRRALPLIDSDEDPYLLLAARHNLIRSFLENGKPWEALDLYFQTRELTERFRDPMLLVRSEWQEGQILRDLGHLEQAEAKLLQVRKDLMERGLAYEVAVLAFDLASLYARMGKVEEVNQIVAEAVPIFRALRIGRESLAALIQLRKTANRESQLGEIPPDDLDVPDSSGGSGR